jgi:hypothetical protein
VIVVETVELAREVLKRGLKVADTTDARLV